MLEDLRRDLPLDQIIVGARAHGIEVDLSSALPGEHDHGAAAASGDGLDEELEAISGAEVVIEQIDVVALTLDLSERLVIELDPIELVTMVLDLLEEISCDEKVLLVILDE